MDPLLTKLIELVLDGSPVALLGVASWLTYLITKIGSNHLHHVQQTLDRIAASAERQESALSKIHTGVEVLLDRRKGD
jgi:hypothetical protein